MVEHKKLVIIPAYNEEATIISQCREIAEAVPDYDLVVINDCSADSTAKLCREESIRVMDLPVNLGIGGAMQTGYRYALSHGYDIAVQVDGDGQHDPAFIPAMYEMLVREGADMVIGSRFIERTGYQSSLPRRIGIGFLSSLIRLLCGRRITDPTSGFRMASGDLIREFALDYPDDYPEPESMVRILSEGRRAVEVPVRMRERAGGRSSIRPLNAVYYMIKVSIAMMAERMRKH